MKNLIIKDLCSKEDDKTEEDHILIISNKSFSETKNYLINKKYDYLICNNTLFDNKDNILYSNYINFDAEKFLSLTHKNKKSPHISITNSKDESSLSNFVKISIKYNLLIDFEFIVKELEQNYGLLYKFDKGFLNFYVKNGLKNIINFLIQKNNYNNIFNCCGNINIKKLKEEKYIDRIKYTKVKKYRREL